MSSWQRKFSTAYFRLRRMVKRPSKEFDLIKVRADVTAGLHFEAMAPAECQPLMVDGMPAEWLTPADVRPGRTLLYLHGGGFIMGSIESHRALATNLAAAMRARALLIEYRLAPEHPFPAGPEDCLSAYRWLLSQGVQPAQLVIAGDSAGGALALTLLVDLRDLGLPLPAAAVSLSPTTDLAMTGESFTSHSRSDVMLDRRQIEYWYHLYLGDHDPCDPRASPLYADLHNLPPLLIQAGNAEMLYSDAVNFAERARAAGVDVTLEIIENGQHVDQLGAQMLPEAREAIRRVGQYVEARMGQQIAG